MSDPTERLRYVAPPAAPSPALPTPPETPTWWSVYRASLDRGAMTETAKRVVETDARYIAGRCIPMPSAEGAWPETRLRRGLVVGSVQSGKTASLLAVAALCLDNGVDVLVVLAGTRIALWRQTYERALAQLDVPGDSAPESTRRDARIFLPDPEVVRPAEPLPALGGLYHAHPNRVIRALRAHKPVVAVVLKQADHLIRFGEQLRDALGRAAGTLRRPLHCVVIDDEADDGSILDQAVEASDDARAELLKQLPRHVARLWSGPRPPHTTFDERVYTTYVAYTATPQANLLQSDHNPLAPSDFIVALRVPLDAGPVAPPRRTTYREDAGLPAYYCGGELFYRRFATAAETFCLEPTAAERARGDAAEPEDPRDANAGPIADLAGPLRAYFVAGAIRLFAAKKSMRAARLGEPYATVDALRAMLPAPHTMLVHPSAALERHFDVAEAIAAWSGEIGAGRDGPVPRDLGGRPRLDAAGLAARLEAEDAAWRAWVARYAQMRDQLAVLPGGVFPAVTEEDWPQLRDLLRDDVFPYVRLVVVNSDPRADDRPEFEPVLDASGGARCPRDTFAIFVAGNVMSRGLTIEGLATTVFLRSSDDPAADTQMQMQRWFGYRGRHLPWCRVFLRGGQLALLRAYHENDEALRADIVRAMNASDPGAPTPLVLQGEDFVATHKVSALRNLPLHPGATPFVRVVETQDPARRAANLAVLTDLLEARPDEWEVVSAAGTARGWILREPLSLVETAALLERLQYTHHNPDVERPEYARFRALERQGGIEAPEAPLLRGPQADRRRSQRVGPRHCPYSIAAYLRFWAAALTRHLRGVFPTDRRDLPWSMCNLRELAARQPRFYVGIRNGSGKVSANPVLATRGVRPMVREVADDYVRATWGTRGEDARGSGGYLGDQLFDYHYHRGSPPAPVVGEPLWRPGGAPGLVLFHVLRGPDEQPSAERLTVGLAIPHGGPDHFAALRGDAAFARSAEDHDGEV